MIGNVEGSVENFFAWYRMTREKPTQARLARWIGFSPRTMANIKRGCFAPGKPYTERPCATRKIMNDDFEVLRDACKSMRLTQR